MCIPAVAAFVATQSTALSVAGSVFGAIGSFQQASAAKQAAKYESSVAAANAKVAEFKAQDVQDRAQADAENLGRQIAGVRGKQQATIAANGIDLSSGSAQSVLDATDFYGAQDQATLANNANKEQWSLRTQKANFEAESQMQKNKASSISPFAALSTSLLGSAGKLADKWSAKEDTGPAFGSGAAWSFAK